MTKLKIILICIIFGVWRSFNVFLRSNRQINIDNDNTKLLTDQNNEGTSLNAFFSIICLVVYLPYFTMNYLIKSIIYGWWLNGTKTDKFVKLQNWFGLPLKCFFQFSFKEIQELIKVGNIKVRLFISRA